MPSNIIYHPIGVIECEITEPLRPEVIKAVEARLVLEPRFVSAIAALEVGGQLQVIYHMHKVDTWQDKRISELFTKRMPSRPNPIGVTVVRIVELEGATITVAGLDAIDGSPILDIKPYRSGSR